MGNYGFSLNNEEEPDRVGEDFTNPDYYISQNGIQPIDIIEEWGLGFHLGNATKYVLRAGHKTEDLEADLRKAIWYMERYIEIKGWE